MHSLAFVETGTDVRFDMLALTLLFTLCKDYVSSSSVSDMLSNWRGRSLEAQRQAILKDLFFLANLWTSPWMFVRGSSGILSGTRVAIQRSSQLHPLLYSSSVLRSICFFFEHILSVLTKYFQSLAQKCSLDLLGFSSALNPRFWCCAAHLAVIPVFLFLCDHLMLFFSLYL